MLCHHSDLNQDALALLPKSITLSHIVNEAKLSLGY